MKFINPYGASENDVANGTNGATGQAGNVFTEQQPKDKFPENDGVVGDDHYAGVYEKPATEVPGTGQTGTGQTGTANAVVTDAATDPKEESLWDNGFANGLAKNKDMTIHQAWGNYNAWAKKNGKDPLDILEVYPYIQKGYDVTKTVEANEQDEKKQQRRENWEKTANVLTHLGNFIGTMFGGISTTKELEDPIELTKRQQLLRDKTLAQRQQNTKDYFQMWKQKQADELARENLKLAQTKADQAERRLDISEAEHFLNQDKFEWKKQMDEKTFDLKKAIAQVNAEVNRGRLSVAQGNLVIRQLQEDLKKKGEESTVTKEVVNPVTGQKETVKQTTVKRPANGSTEPTGTNKPTGKKPNPMKS